MVCQQSLRLIFPTHGVTLGGSHTGISAFYFASIRFSIPLWLAKPYLGFRFKDDRRRLNRALENKKRSYDQNQKCSFRSSVRTFRGSKNPLGVS